MHPQSELENYKLQVELLQEKLHRSEDNRHELEAKLEQILKKRSEHERTLRSRTQKKYQQFLDEQKKRNQRNRKLIEMLEHIDQQAAELSARSERLRSMKIQYEMYFSKLVQANSLKALKNISSVPTISSQDQAFTYVPIQTENIINAKTYQTSFNNNTSPFQTVPVPLLVPISNEANRFDRSWRFPNVQQGVLIALPSTSTFLSAGSISDTKKNEFGFDFDYTQFPIGYLQKAENPNHIEDNKKSSHLEEHHHQIQSNSTLMPKPSSVDNSELSRSHFDYGYQNSSLFSNLDSRSNGMLPNRIQPEYSQQFCKPYIGNREYLDNSGISKCLEKGEKVTENSKNQILEVLKDDSLLPRQGLNVDKLPKINSKNYFQPEAENGRVVRKKGSEFNAIDFRTDDNDEYIKSTKEIKETNGTNISLPSGAASQQQSNDNITTALRVQKIDETNVKDDEKINDVEDNEKNTSLAFPPLGGKCSMESIGDEALTRKALGRMTRENTSNASASNIDPNRDTEQITLFNGTKNSLDEGTGASNRTSVVIDDGGENIANAENKHSEASASSYRPKHFDRKEKMSLDNIETAIYGELLSKPNSLTSTPVLDKSRMKESEPSASQTSLGIEDCKKVSKQSLQQDDIEVEQVQVHTNANESDHSNIGELRKVEENDENHNDLQPETIAYIENESEYLKTTPVDNFQQQQEEFLYSEDGQQLPNDDYSTDYQNYDASQYQEMYDPNNYQYNYEQQEYNDPNQQYTDPNKGQYGTEQEQYTDANQEQYLNPEQENYTNPNQGQYAGINQDQYTADGYSQEYQTDSYPDQYVNYDENIDGDARLYNPEQSNEQISGQQQIAHTYPEQDANQEPQYSMEELQINDETLHPKQEIIDINKNDTQQKTVSVSESNEDISPTQKLSVPTSILTSEKNNEATATKKKKRVNFVDSETDESFNQPRADAISSESDFDFSTSN